LSRLNPLPSTSLTLGTFDKRYVEFMQDLRAPEDPNIAVEFILAPLRHDYVNERVRHRRVDSPTLGPEDDRIGWSVLLENIRQRRLS
jgi:hypothetical protein